MTPITRVLSTVAVGAAVMLSTVTARAQSSPPAQGHEHGNRPVVTRPAEGTGEQPAVAARIVALDRRIAMLTGDMQMFSGEMRVDAMASLITAMIERQTLVEQEMRTMREGMMRRMMGRGETSGAAVDQEPGGMCAPEK